MRKLWGNLWSNLLGGVISVSDKVCVLCGWIDSDGNNMIDSDGNAMVFRD